MAIQPAKRGRVIDTRIELFENTAIQLTCREDFVQEIGKLWSDAQQKFVLIGRYLIQAKQILRLKALLLGIMSKHTGQPLEVIERDSDRDYYLEAKGAVDYGLVDQVLETPEKVK